jgi:hypothetical protein
LRKSRFNLNRSLTFFEFPFTWATGGSNKSDIRSKQLNKVFVLDTNKKVLSPIEPVRARILFNRGKAAVYRRNPFTIILKVAIADPVVEQVQTKIDAENKTTH